MNEKSPPLPQGRRLMAQPAENTTHRLTTYVLCEETTAVTNEKGQINQTFRGEKIMPLCFLTKPASNGGGGDMATAFGWSGVGINQPTEREGGARTSSLPFVHPLSGLFQSLVPPGSVFVQLPNLRVQAFLDTVYAVYRGSARKNKTDSGTTRARIDTSRQVCTLPQSSMQVVATNARVFSAQSQQPGVLLPSAS